MKVGFLGAGKMAAALAQGFIRAGRVSASEILASDPSSAALGHFAQATAARTTTSNREVVRFGDVVVLAVKPDQVQAVLSEEREVFTGGQLLISIAAGVPLVKLQRLLGGKGRVIRVMPNAPALAGASASAFAVGEGATEADARLALSLLSAVGLALEVKESLLDAVTGLSGSGPAYVFMMIEALSDGGVAAGLPREAATRLAIQTVLGSAKLALETGLHPGVLKDMVTSPGGTTIEGLQVLEKGGVRAALIGAVRAAAEKSRQLGQS